MRLVRCGLFVLAFVIGIQLFCVSLWRNAYLLDCHDVFHHAVSRRIDYLGRIKNSYIWMVSEERRGYCRLAGHGCKVSA